MYELLNYLFGGLGLIWDYKKYVKLGKYYYFVNCIFVILK